MTRRQMLTAAIMASLLIPVAAGAQAPTASLNELIAKGLDELPENFAAVDALIGQSVNVLHDNHVIHTGTACGLNALGQLRVRTAQGEQAVSVGEISVRPR